MLHLGQRRSHLLPASRGWREVQHDRHSQPGQGDHVPRAPQDVDHHAVPEHGGGRKEKAEDRPEERAKYPNKPGGEEPQPHNDDAGYEEGEHSKKNGHGTGVASERAVRPQYGRAAIKQKMPPTRRVGGVENTDVGRAGGATPAFSMRSSVAISSYHGATHAPRVGFEPTTLRLTAACSTVELPRICFCVRCYLYYRQRIPKINASAATNQPLDSLFKKQAIQKRKLPCRLSVCFAPHLARWPPTACDDHCPGRLWGIGEAGTVKVGQEAVRIDGNARNGTGRER